MIIVGKFRVVIDYTRLVIDYTAGLVVIDYVIDYNVHHGN